MTQIHVVNFNYKVKDGIIINTTSRSNNWSRGLSPFFCGPVELYDGYISQNHENGWQYSKLFEYYADEDGNPTDRYFKWAQDGWAKTRADRYPMGRDVKPICSYWAGEKLSYVEARKKIYIPLYSKAVSKTSAFQKLKEVYNNSSEDLYLQDFDAHNIPPGTFNYWDLWNNDKIKVGHAYVLAMMLESWIQYGDEFTGLCENIQIK